MFNGIKNKCLLVIIGLLILSFILLADSSLLIAQESSDTVRIKILTKQLRLLKEGKLHRLTFNFPGHTVLTNKSGGNIIPVNKLRFVKDFSGIKIIAGDQMFEGFFHLRILNNYHNSFWVSFNNDMRKYPLPFEISSTKNGMAIIIKEDIYRYAIDSALAEYGTRKKEEIEAVRSLALVTIGRIHYNKKCPVHKGYDFCDLTHCQVYRGRLSRNATIKKFSWIPSVKGLKAQLLFHSRCGGKTFDGRIFGQGSKGLISVRDTSTDFHGPLCGKSRLSWSRTIGQKELVEILYKNRFDEQVVVDDITFDKENLKVILSLNGNANYFYPENFRLRINRVMGWSFIRSNNYVVKKILKNSRVHFKFNGKGLGHGVGLCQHGALNLARMGYSRYELLNHYYPNLKFKKNNNKENILPHNLSYLIFSLRDGSVLKCSHRNILSRKMPPGSLYKILVALYLARYHPDLIYQYRFTCRGKNYKHEILPQCWSPEPHGTIGFTRALAVSCNTYFASLSRFIDRENFLLFMRNFYRSAGINEGVPTPKNKKEFARLLPGLDFRMRLSVKDMMKIGQIISVHTTPEKKSLALLRSRFPFSLREEIHHGLIKVLTEGTGAGDVKRYGKSKSHEFLSEYNNIFNKSNLFGTMWGKTSTSAAGSNKTVSYGLFLGGYRDKGIVTILRHGNGHLAAKWAIYLMDKYIE